MAAASVNLPAIFAAPSVEMAGLGLPVASSQNVSLRRAGERRRRQHDDEDSGDGEGRRRMERHRGGGRGGVSQPRGRAPDAPPRAPLVGPASRCCRLLRHLRSGWCRRCSSG